MPIEVAGGAAYLLAAIEVAWELWFLGDRAAGSSGDPLGAPVWATVECGGLGSAACVSGEIGRWTGEVGGLLGRGYLVAGKWWEGKWWEGNRRLLRRRFRGGVCGFVIL